MMARPAGTGIGAAAATAAEAPDSGADGGDGSGGGNNSNEDNKLPATSSSSGGGAATARPYTPPVWLFHPSNDNTSKAYNQRRVKQYLVPIPPVSPETHQAVVAHLSSSSTLLPHQTAARPIAGVARGARPTTDRRQVLRAKLLEQQQRLAQVRERALQLELDKEQALHDVETMRQAELERHLHQIAQQRRTQYAQERMVRHQVWKQAIADEVRASWANDQKMRNVDDDNNDNAANMQNETAAATAAGPAVGGEHDAAAPPPASIDDSKPAAAVDNDNQTAPAEPAVAAAQAQHEAAQAALAAAQAKLDALHETRTDVIWLLKQVIKAEEKQKMVAAGAAKGKKDGGAPPPAAGSSSGSSKPA